MNIFESSNIPRLFGYEDAADEDSTRLKEYFFKRGDYDAIKSDLPLSIVVGFKGVGKSALLKIAYEEDHDENCPAIWIRPDDIIEMVDELSDDLDFSKMVLLWKRGIAKLVASRIASDWMFTYGEDAKSALIWAQETGYRSRDFIQRTVSLINPSLKKTISMDGETTSISVGEHHVVKRLLEDKKIFLYFDDLDAGWEASDLQRKRLSALLLALRNMTSDIQGLKARLALRTDVYTLLRESDESTDKFENYVVNCNWNNHDILVLLVKRILTYFGESIEDEKLNSLSQHELNDYLSRVMETRFTKTKEWKNKHTHRVIMSLIRSRPRDMIKLCTFAAKAASQRDITSEVIEDIDFESILSDYSLNRVQDIVNEFKFEITNLEAILYRLAPTKSELREKRGRSKFVYTTSELLEKIKNVMSNSNIKLSYRTQTTPIDVAHFLFKIGFITARKTISGKIERKYYDEKKQLLKSGQIGDGGYAWEVHPSYRSAISTTEKFAWMSTVDIDD
ncbi:TPA: hypothetical protein ACPJ2O_004467 [Vibrio diabolicus]